MKLGDICTLGNPPSFSIPSFECQLALIPSINQRQMRWDFWITVPQYLPAVHTRARADPGPIKDKTNVLQWSHVYLFINPPNPRKMANLVYAPRATLLHHGDGSARVVFRIAHSCNLSNPYWESSVSHRSFQIQHWFHVFTEILSNNECVCEGECKNSKFLVLLDDMFIHILKWAYFHASGHFRYHYFLMAAFSFWDGALLLFA